MEPYDFPTASALNMLPSRDSHMDFSATTEDTVFNTTGSWIIDELEYDFSEIAKITKRYPKWTILPREECEYLKLNNLSLWLLLNHHSNITTGIPVQCLGHAPQLDMSNTVQAITLSVMFVISLVGNVLTVYSISTKHKSSRQYSSSVYSLIFHLSIADLLVTVTCLFGEAAWSYSVSWLADNFTCKLFKFVQVFSLYLSTFVLVLIGLDRFLAVKYPMKTLSTKRRCNRLVITVWILSLLLSSPQVRKIF